MASASSLPDELIIRIAECLIAPDQYAIPYQKLYWQSDTWPNLRMRDFADRMAPGTSRNHLCPSPVALAVFRPSLLAEFAKLLHKTAVFYFEDSEELYKYLERPGINQSSLDLRKTMRFVRLMEWGDMETVKRTSPPYCLEPVCNLHNTCCRACNSFTPSLDCRLSILPYLQLIHVDEFDLQALDERWLDLFGADPDRFLKIEFRKLVCSMWPLFEKARDLRTVFFAGPGEFGRWTLAPDDDLIDGPETPRELHRKLMSVLGKIVNEIERFPMMFPVDDGKEGGVREGQDVRRRDGDDGLDEKVRRCPSPNDIDREGFINEDSLDEDSFDEDSFEVDDDDEPYYDEEEDEVETYWLRKLVSWHR